MHRLFIRVSLVSVLGMLGTVVGTFAAVFFTPAGRGLAGRALAERMNGLVRGDVEVGAVGGTVLTGLDLDQLVIRDSAGALLADIPHAELRYRLPELLAGRIVLQRLTLDHPVFHVIKHRDGRMNYEEVLHLGESAGHGPGTLVRFSDVEIRDGSLQLDVPWSPPDSMRTRDLARQALLIDRARPGRVIEAGPEGLTRRIRFDRLTARFPMMRLGTPDHQPILFIVDSLATRISDPAVTVVALNGTVDVDGTTLSFKLSRIRLPHSTFAGVGKVRWPDGPPLFDFALDGSAVDLTDLRWISPGFPAMSGRAKITALSRNAERTDYRFDQVSLAGADGRIEGGMTALVDDRRGLGVDRMALTLTGLDLDVARPYLDTLPFHGTLTGTLAGGGFLDSLDVDLDWSFRDAAVAGHPESRVSAAGHLQFGGAEGTRFDTLTLRQADLDLATVRRVAPGVPLEGRLAASGTLSGPWTDLTFAGTATHQDGDRPASTAVGTMRLDTRSALTGFAVDVTLEPLDFDGIRRSVPRLPVSGDLRGHVALSGTARQMRVDAEVAGAAGAVRIRGGFGQDAAGWKAESLMVEVRGLDTRAVSGSGPVTDLSGTVLLDGVLDSLRGPVGSAQLVLGAGTVGEFAFDSGTTRLHAVDGMLRFDTLAGAWPGGTLNGAGAIGWSAPQRDSLVAVVDVKTLRPLDPVVTELTGLTHDTTPDSRPLGGALRGSLTLGGSIDSLVLFARARLTDVGFGQTAVRGATVEFTRSGGARPAVSARVMVDTASIGDVGLADGALAAAGSDDSLVWSLASRIGQVDSVAAAGAWVRGAEAGSRITLDSLRGVLNSHHWGLVRPSRVDLAAGGTRIDTFDLATDDGASELRLAGTVPGASTGELRFHTRDVDVRDITGLLGADTLGLTGRASVDLMLGGTAAAPTAQGTAAFADAGFATFRGPYARAVVHYADRALDLDIALWRTGRQVMSVDARLPIDLAFGAVGRRLVPGPLDIRVLADRADVGMVEAFTPNARDLSGSFSADAGIQGTWEDPRLTGTVRLLDAGVSIPSLGVRYDRINGAARLEGDGITLDSLTLRGGEGTLSVTGGVRLAQLTRPVFDLDLKAQAFRALDVRNYLTLVGTGQLRLTGPFFGAALTGRMTADEGVLYFADLVTKQVVDLSDPATAALIDTAQMRDARLAPSIENRFLDSLSINNLRLSVGDEFWLRSTEANIRLTGDMTVSKAARNYRLDGTLKADRGNYALKVGFITRPFTVQSGTVRFLGTPDLNAELDIQAVHTVRPADASADIGIVAHITGTTLAPKLSLASPQNPTLSETELVSYLMFGRPSFALDQTGGATQGGEEAALQTGIAYLSSALSTEIERALVSDLGVPVDFVEIRPGGAGGSFVNPNAGLTTLSAGWRIGKRTFFTFNAGLCPNLGQLGYKSFGASVEQRFDPWLRAQVSVEPVQTCQPNVTVSTLGATNQYQLGLDLLWEREY
ncbi:MAG TPA: translocation/assembly module TamB domain-containing protein [Gemmatimonadales bacterium]|nr:translocation/assembly module TamB domain-containing protein [Gemmatimonadales bacterium]